MSYQFPYYARIMIAQPGQEPVELFRSHRSILAAQWRFQIRDLDPSWEKWVEQRTPDRFLLSPRTLPELKTAGKLRVRIAHAELEGIPTEYEN